jgi:hypothetical protein
VVLEFDDEPDTVVVLVVLEVVVVLVLARPDELETAPY